MSNERIAPFLVEETVTREQFNLRIEQTNTELDAVHSQLDGNAFIPCAASYDAVTKRHTLIPTQEGLTLPEVFTVRFTTAAAFGLGDKVYIGGKEYTPAYTDSTDAVATGAWAAGATVGVTCAAGKAFVGAGFIEHFEQKTTQLTADINLYVSPSGNDTTGDGTQSKPFATLQRVLDTVPKNLGGYNCLINLANGNYTTNGVIKVYGFYNGNMKVIGPADGYANFVNTSIEIKGINCILSIHNHLKIVSGAASEDSCIRVTSSFGTLKFSVDIDGGGTKKGVNFYVPCNCTVMGVISNCTVAVNTGGSGLHAGIITLIELSGTGNTVAYNAVATLVVVAWGVTISGTTAQSYGGRIFN